MGDGRGCAGALTRPSTRHLTPKNFEKTALRKRVGIFTVKMRGGHIYGNYWKKSIYLYAPVTFARNADQDLKKVPQMIFIDLDT